MLIPDPYVWSNMQQVMNISMYDGRVSSTHFSAHICLQLYSPTREEKHTFKCLMQPVIDEYQSNYFYLYGQHTEMKGWQIAKSKYCSDLYTVFRQVSATQVACLGTGTVKLVENPCKACYKLVSAANQPWAMVTVYILTVP